MRAGQSEEIVGRAQVGVEPAKNHFLQSAGLLLACARVKEVDSRSSAA
jgi:hypothetical protein